MPVTFDLAFDKIFMTTHAVNQRKPQSGEMCGFTVFTITIFTKFATFEEFSILYDFRYKCRS